MPTLKIFIATYHRALHSWIFGLAENLRASPKAPKIELRDYTWKKSGLFTRNFLSGGRSGIILLVEKELPQLQQPNYLVTKPFFRLHALLSSTPPGTVSVIPCRSSRITRMGSWISRMEYGNKGFGVRPSSGRSSPFSEQGNDHFDGIVASWQLGILQNPKL